MKKFFKPTLFKKNFIIIFVCLIVIEGFHLYLDYESNVRESISSITSGQIVQSLEHLSLEFIEDSNKSYKDKTFFSEFDDTFKNMYGYSAIVNEQGNIIHEILPKTPYNNLPFLWLRQKNNLDYSCKTNLNSLKKENIAKVEDYICTSFNNNPNKPIYLEFSGERKSDDEFTPTYLKIDDEVIIGETNSQNVEQYLIEEYYSDNYRYTSYSSEGKATLTDYNIIYDICREMVSGNYESYGAIGEVDIGMKRVNNDLFTMMSSTIARNSNNANGRGTLVHVYFSIDCLDDILDNTIASKQDVYILAFFMTIAMSFLISYLTTKRVKEIDKVTHRIADNYFDITLKEAPHDELGGLSKSINLMSQQLKNTIDQLNQEIEKVKNLESLRKDFINQFTHEMKTPLGIINGYSELIEESKNEEEVNKYLNIINRETNRVNELIQSMLKLSRLEAKKVELNRVDIDLEESVVSIIDEYEVLLMKKNIKVEVNVIQSMINADKKLIETVIHNFLSNAIKHTEEYHKIIIDINDGVSIFNEGRAIDEDKIENIWYTFVTHDQEGTGLGLAICKTILELHGFSYGVDNKDGGVSFWFRAM